MFYTTWRDWALFFLVIGTAAIVLWEGALYVSRHLSIGWN